LTFPPAEAIKALKRVLAGETLVCAREHLTIERSLSHGSVAALRHNWDGKRGKLQIGVWLLCGAEGCPVAVEVYPGNRGDPTTLASQILKVRERWGLNRVVWVGDRGLLTDARIDQELRPVEGLEWITALRAPALGAMVEGCEL